MSTHSYNQPLASITKKPQVPKPSYFIVRPGGSFGAIVPLIPYDELPPTITISGTSRSLELQETIGMVNLGLVRNSGAMYTVTNSEDGNRAESEKRTTIIEAREPGSKAQTSLTQSVVAPLSTITNGAIASISTKGTQAPPTTPIYYASPTSTPVKSITTIPTTHPALRVQPHNTQSRQACRHWLNYGTCKWAPHCRYEHRMPTTVCGLEANGLRGWPLWWVVKNGGRVGSGQIISNAAHNHIHEDHRQGSNDSGARLQECDRSGSRRGTPLSKADMTEGCHGERDSYAYALERSGRKRTWLKKETGNPSAATGSTKGGALKLSEHIQRVVRGRPSGEERQQVKSKCENEKAELEGQMREIEREVEALKVEQNAPDGDMKTYEQTVDRLIEV